MKKIYSILLAGTVILSLASCQGGQKKAAEKAAQDSIAAAAAAAAAVPKDNTLSAEETSAGWTLLFDGTTSTGWRGYNKTEFPKGWEVVEGTLHCIGTGTGEAAGAACAGQSAGRCCSPDPARAAAASYGIRRFFGAARLLCKYRSPDGRVPRPSGAFN